MALAMEGRFVKVDDRCATSTTNVLAIGDLVGEPILAHKASAQGEMDAEAIAGKRRRFDPVAIPAVCFTEPEIVSVGLGPDTPDTVTGIFPFAANGGALSMDAGDEGGFVRVVARVSDRHIIGVQAVGAHISEPPRLFQDKARERFENPRIIIDQMVCLFQFDECGLPASSLTLERQ
jgi:dihydrolipoamide dehydrogenase